MPKAPPSTYVKVCPSCGSIAIFRSGKRLACRECGREADDFPQLTVEDLQSFRDQLERTKRGGWLSTPKKKAKGIKTKSSRAKIIVILLIVLALLFLLAGPFLAELF